jgi:hypothetical protein
MTGDKPLFRQVVDAAAGKIICEVVSMAATDRDEALSARPMIENGWLYSASARRWRCF